MSELKSYTMTYFEVDSNNLDSFIYAVLGKKYEFAAAEEAHDSYHVFNKIGQEIYKSDYSDKKIKDWLDSDKDWDYPLYHTGSILELLCEQGHIPPGNYLVSCF